jgi:hypothetical protein
MQVLIPLCSFQTRKHLMVITESLSDFTTGVSLAPRLLGTPDSLSFFNKKADVTAGYRCRTQTKGVPSEP